MKFYYPNALVSSSEHGKVKHISTYTPATLPEVYAQLEVWRRSFYSVYCFWIEEADTLKVDFFANFTDTIGNVRKLEEPK